jgi:hypothetical protein
MEGGDGIERSLKMKYIRAILRSLLTISLFSGIVSSVAVSEKPDLVEQTIESIRICINQSTSQWPDEWKKEYLDTIRKAIELHPDVPHYTTRLEILVRGFESYWESFEKTQERSLFDVYQARIRWYTEHLMGSEFPTEKERQKLSDQYKDIWNYATNSLLAQFPFLDPNAVRNAKQEDLSVCYIKIEAPLMPVYLRPFSEEQLEQIKQRWDRLRYARVNLWRKLVGDLTMPDENSEASANAKRDYKLTKESLSQLLGIVWGVIPKRPDYYLKALDSRNMALKLRIQLKRQARIEQQHLEKTRSRQLPQTEYISFLLTALLETKRHLDRSESVNAQEKSCRNSRTNLGKEVVSMI